MKVKWKTSSIVEDGKLSNGNYYHYFEAPIYGIYTLTVSLTPTLKENKFVFELEMRVSQGRLTKLQDKFCQFVDSVTFDDGQYVSADWLNDAKECIKDVFDRLDRKAVGAFIIYELLRNGEYAEDSMALYNIAIGGSHDYFDKILGVYFSKPRIDGDCAEVGG